MADTVEKHTFEYNVASAVRAADNLSKALVDQAAAMELVNDAAKQLKGADFSSQFVVAKRAIDLLNKLEKVKAKESKAIVKEVLNDQKTQEQLYTQFLKEEQAKRRAERKRDEAAARNERKRTNTELVKDAEDRGKAETKEVLAEADARTKELENLIKAGEARLTKEHKAGLTNRQNLDKENAKKLVSFDAELLKGEEKRRKVRANLETTFANEQHKNRVAERVKTEKDEARARQNVLDDLRKDMEQRYKDEVKASEQNRQRIARIGNSFSAVGERAFTTQTKFEKKEFAKREKFLETTLKNQEAAFGKFKGSLSRLNVFAGLTESADTFSGALRAIVTYGLLNQITSNLSQAFTRAADLQVKIAEIQTLSQRVNVETGATAGTFRTDDAIRKDIGRISDLTGLDQIDVAAASYEAVSNQIQGAAENFDFLEDSAKFALAAVSTQNDAVQLLSATLNSYNLAASRASEVSAKWFKAIDLGRFTVAELSLDIGRSAVLGNQLGITLDELAAAYSTMTIQGVKFANAQTFLTNIMLKLIKPTDNMKEIFNEWGVTSGKAAIELFGLNGVLRKLDAVSKRSGDSLAELGEQFSTIRAIVGATILGDNADQFDKNLRQISTAQESFNQAFEIRITNSGQIVKTELKQIENFFTNEFGNSIVKVLANFSGQTQDISEGFEKVFEVVTRAIPAIVAFKTAFAIGDALKASFLALGTYKVAVQATAAAMATLGITSAATINIMTLGLASIPIALGGLVSYLAYDTVDSFELFGSAGEKAFTKINEAADKALKDYKASSIIVFQQTADDVTNSFNFLSKGLALAQVKQLSETNRLIKGIVSGSTVFQDALSRGFAASEIELNKQVFLLKDFNNVLDDSQREIDKLSEDFKQFADELGKDIQTADKIIREAIDSVADFRKEVALAKKAPGSISETVAAAQFQDEISKFEEIADVRERVKALLEGSETKKGEGLSLFNVGKIEEGNSKTQEAIALLSKTKDLIVELKKTQPELALGLPTPEEITKRLEFFDKEIEKRRAAVELPKVNALINESNFKSQEAFAQLEAGDLEKAEQFFKDSQSLFREASSLAENLKASGIETPITSAFVNAFEARTEEFAGATQQIKDELIKNYAAGLSQTTSAQLDQMFRAQAELGRLAEGVTDKFVDNGFIEKIQNEVSSIGESADALAAEFNALIDAVSRGIIDQPDAEKRLEGLNRRLTDINDDLKFSNEQTTNANREALDLQSKQEQALSKIADRYREIEKLAAQGDSAAIKSIRELEAANIADLNALKETGVKLSDAAQVAAADFSNQISANLLESGDNLEALVQELESIIATTSSLSAKNLDVRGAIANAIEDPQKIQDLSNLFDEIRKEGNVSANNVVDKLTNATDEYSNTLNTFDNIQSGLNDLAQGKIDIDTQLIGTTQELVSALQQRIQLEKEQNRILEASDQLAQVSSDLETSKGVATNAVGDLAKGIQRARSVIELGIKDQLKAQEGIEANDATVDAVLNGTLSSKRGFNPYSLPSLTGAEDAAELIVTDFSRLGPILTDLESLVTKIQTKSISPEELAQVLPVAQEQLNQLAASINEATQAPDLSAINALAPILDQAKNVGALGTPEVLDESLKKLFNEASPAAERQAAAESLAKQANVVANSEKLVDESLRYQLTQLVELAQSAAKGFESISKGGGDFQEVLTDISNALLSVGGDDVTGRAPLNELIANSNAIDQSLTEQQNVLEATLKSLGFTESQIQDITKDTIQLDKERNELLERISSNTDNLSPTLARTLNDLNALKRNAGIPEDPMQPSLGLATGGRVPRKGTDSVMAALTPGEFVLRKSVADKIGSSSLHMLNNGVVPQTLASGGAVTGNLKRLFDEIKEQGRSLFAAELSKIGLELETINSSTVDARNRIFAVGAYSAKSKGYGSRVPTDGSQFNARKVFKIPGMSSGIPLDSTGIDLTPRLLAENSRLEISAKADKLKRIGEELYRQQAGALGYTVESLSSSVDTATGAFKVIGAVLKRSTANIGGFGGNAPSSTDLPKQFDLKKYLTTLAVGGFVPNRKDISGFGTDSVLAALTPGEFVIKAASAKKLGPAFLNSINGYASGGRVGKNSLQELLIEFLKAKQRQTENAQGISDAYYGLKNKENPNPGYYQVLAAMKENSNAFYADANQGEEYYQPTYEDRQQAIGRMSGDRVLGNSNIGQIRDGGAPSSVYSEEEYKRLFGLRAFNTRYYADGGPVGTDTVNAWLTPGEYVMNKKSTQMFGPLLDAINKTGLGSSVLNKVVGPYFAEGGLIPSAASRNVAFDPRDVGNNYFSNENQFNLTATGSEPVDASRLVYYINKQQRSGVAHLNSRRSRPN